MLDKLDPSPIHQQDNVTEPFSLQRRQIEGGTKRLSYWGFDNETDPLTDVLLASPDHLRHLATSSLSRKALRESPADIRVAQAQHRELAHRRQQPIGAGGNTLLHLRLGRRCERYGLCARPRRHDRVANFDSRIDVA